MWTAAMVTARMASPHQLPSICQCCECQTRRMSTKLTSGINMPIDLSASNIHRFQRLPTIHQMELRLRTARTTASLAVCGGAKVATCGLRRGRTSAAGRVDIRVRFFRGAGEKRYERSARLFGVTASFDASARRDEEGTSGADYGQDCGWIFWRLYTATLRMQWEGDGKEESEAEEQE